MSRERVEQAAVRLRGQMFVGESHKAAVRVAADKLKLSTSTVWREAGRGFLTSLGEFVDRREAWRIAVAAGQITPHLSEGGVRELFSEDLRRPEGAR